MSKLDHKSQHPIVLFDYFGVVGDDAYWCTIKGIEILNGHEQLILDLHEKVNDGRVSWQQYCQTVADDLAIPIEEITQRYEQHNINEATVRLIQTLSQHYVVALASNAASEHLLPIMQRNGIDKLFDRMFFSSDIGASKPSTAFFQFIFDSYQKDGPQFIFIDDSMVNVRAAEALGVTGIVFESASQVTSELADVLN